MEILKGTGVALVTPFHEDGSVDFEGLSSLIDYVSDKVEYLVVHGTTGETATTNTAEKKAIFDFVREKNAGKLPLVYGIGGNNTAAIIETIQNTDLEGVSAILSVSPYYNKPSQEGIFQHYTAIANASDLPIILYNVPGRTGSNVEVDTTLRLAAHPNIIGTKDATGDLSHCIRIAEGMPEDFLLLSGDDILTPALVAIGGSGAISVLANGLPGIMAGMVRASLANDPDKANELNGKLLDINPLMYAESNPVGVKEILRQRGVCGNQVRLPLWRASETLQKQVKEELEKL